MAATLILCGDDRRGAFAGMRGEPPFASATFRP
jgi:hypothetical protein